MGEDLAVIGSIKELGFWDQGRALRMGWNDGNIWKGILIFENKCIEYDYDKDSATFEILNSNVYIVQNKNFKIEQYKIIH